MELVCSLCGKSSIPAPPGANGKTRFTCRICCGEISRQKLEPVPADDSPETQELALRPATVVPGSEPEMLYGEDLPRPKSEALALFRLLRRNGTTREEIRSLISVPAEAVEQARSRRDAPALKAFAWRGRVLAEFDRLGESVTS
jgi:hypothetical protein